MARAPDALCVIQTKGALMAKQVADKALIHPKDARKILFELHKASILGIREIAKNKDMNPSHTYYLFNYDQAAHESILRERLAGTIERLRDILALMLENNQILQRMRRRRRTTRARAGSISQTMMAKIPPAPIAASAQPSSRSRRPSDAQTAYSPSFQSRSSYSTFSFVIIIIIYLIFKKKCYFASIAQHLYYIYIF